ncbi:MAG: hypothetical protein WHX52_05370 [Anaerolineae bacterium]
MRTIRQIIIVTWVFVLVWGAGVSGCSPGSGSPAASLPTDPLLQPAQITPLTHASSTPDLPAPHPRRELSFRYAAHTIFLDEVIAPVVAEGGFDTVVQVFPWRDLHPEPDRYDWDPADYMVRMAHAQHLDLVVRLDMPPAWAILPEEYSHGGIPFDLSAYADFVAAVAERYRGYILGYIIWNEPNLAAEWSRSGGDVNQHWESFDGWVARPDDYVYVLCVAYERIRAADPDALVVAAGMAPTNEMSPRAIDDREFLRGMYAAGAKECFDVLSVHDYGYGLSPEAPRELYDGLNLARILDVRDIMLSYGDDRPVWITELGYTIQPGMHPYVTEENQAAYLIGALRRVRREWPWVEMFTVWNLCYGLPLDSEMAGFSLVAPDLTPRLAYQVLQEEMKR